MQRVDKSLKSPRTAEKIDTFTDHSLENIQNVTPSIHLINTSLFYQKDNSDNSVCVGDMFFQEKVIFKERAG